MNSLLTLSCYLGSKYRFQSQIWCPMYKNVWGLNFINSKQIKSGWLHLGRIFSFHWEIR